MSKEKDAVVKNILESNESINRLYSRMQNNGEKLRAALDKMEAKIAENEKQEKS